MSLVVVSCCFYYKLCPFCGSLYGSLSLLCTLILLPLDKKVTAALLIMRFGGVLGWLNLVPSTWHSMGAQYISVFT